jgi:hypothetical protein
MNDNVSRCYYRRLPPLLTVAQFDFNPSMDFTNPSNNSMDVLQDFDFDSFLHQDAEGVDTFSFDTSGFNMDGDGIGAE